MRSLLTVVVLSMPVSYRGGTEVAHPHSIFHFLTDAATGSMDHHRRWRHAGAARDYRHGAIEPAAVVESAPPGVPALEALVPALERTSGIGLVLLVAVAAILGNRPTVLDASSKLIGVSVRPSVPPPRPTAPAG